MIVLGIDPGSRKTGFAFVELRGREFKLLHSGILNFEQYDLFLDRIIPIYEETKKLTTLFPVDAVSMESLIYVKSPTALIKLAQTRGVILSALSEVYAHKIFEYSPNLVKSTTVGHGHADKEGIQKFLDMLLGKRTYKTSDESDAIAIALCHLLKATSKLPEKKITKLLTVKKASRSLKASLSHLAHKKIG
ncbi:MAG: crossover junction endodeoxyribonuclease RuvC [Bacteriovoracaceae bacterium]